MDTASPETTFCETSWLCPVHNVNSIIQYYLEYLANGTEKKIKQLVCISRKKKTKAYSFACDTIVSKENLRCQ